VDGDGDVRVKEAVHIDCHREKHRLGKVLVLRKGQEGFMEVAVGYEDEGVLAWMGAKGKDTGNRSFKSSKCVVMAGAEATFDACAAREGEKGHDEVVRMGDGIDVD